MELFSLSKALLILIGTLSALIGWLLFWPRLRGTERPRISDWLQTDLSRPYFIEKLIYRHHRVFGALVSAAAVLWLWLLSRWTAWQQIWQYIQSHEMTVLGLSLMALFALCIGIILWIRPSILKPFERIVNHWTNPTIQKSKPKNGVLNGISQMILNHPIVAGIIMMAAGVICLRLGL